QHALDGVSVHVGQLAHGEVAEGNTGEDSRLVPLTTVHQVAHQVESPEEVASSEELVQEEDLDDQIGEIGDLGGDVERGDVRAEVVAESEAEEAVVVGLLVTVAHVERLVEVLGQLLCLDLPSDRRERTHLLRIGNGVLDVDSGLLVEGLPDPVGNVEHDGLQGEHDGHPLVVPDLDLLPLLVLTRDLVLHGHVEGVLDEAVVLRVLLPSATELHRSPALDWRADIP
ncbi:hypothetical protein PMAYCL1PPCAC_32213, partial [Pristionchus mayeri]